MRTALVLTAAALVTFAVVGVAGGFIYTIAHATVRVLETLTGGH